MFSHSIFMKRFTSIKVSALAVCAVGAGMAHAADISSYGVAKAHLYTQNSEAAPAEVPGTPYAFTAWVDGAIAAITSALVQTPSAFPFELPLNDAASRYETSVPGTLQTLGFVAGNGTYSFTIESENDLISLAQLNHSSTAFPTTVPQISNFTAAQDIDPAASFTLNWNTTSDAPSYRLVITGNEGEVVEQEGSASGFTIPAGTLQPDSSYTGKLRFRKILATDTTSIPGAIGTAELYNETEFTLVTSGGGGGGGGGDTDAPFLFLTSPTIGATGVSVSTAVSFTFTEPMIRAQSIQWSANVNAGAFTYAWGNGDKTLTATYAGGFPANATITWTLNPATFKDLAGNALFAFNLNGSFTTGSGGGSTNDPCNNPGESDGRGFGFLAKTANFVQTGNANPVASGASFAGNYRGASNQTVTAVSVAGPVNRTMETFAGFFFLSEQVASAAALDAAVPAGNYTLSATGAGSASLALGAVSQVPIPKINNLVELAAMNPASAFTLNFAPFTGATANDSISISITEKNGDGEFHAPDPCKNILLPNTATSVTIPAGAFKAGAQYQGSISFSKGAGFNTNTIPGTTVYANATAQTEFGFTLGGGPQPTALRWTSIRRNANGTLSFILTADAGANVVIEGGDGSPLGWLQAGAGIATGGTFEFVVDPRLQTSRLYRAKKL